MKFIHCRTSNFVMCTCPRGFHKFISPTFITKGRLENVCDSQLTHPDLQSFTVPIPNAHTYIWWIGLQMCPTVNTFHAPRSQEINNQRLHSVVCEWWHSLQLCYFSPCKPHKVRKKSTWNPQEGPVNLTERADHHYLYLCRCIWSALWVELFPSGCQY